MKLLFLYLVLALSSLVQAEEEKCNPVAIAVDATPVFYSGRAVDEAESLYKAGKLKEAIIKYREAYKIISDDRNKLATEVMRHKCANVPMKFGTQVPASSSR